MVENSIIQLEHDVYILQKTMDYIMHHNKNIKMPNSIEYQKIMAEAIEVMRKKYPNMGIKKM